jgi:hypothetical protein
MPSNESDRLRREAAELQALASRLMEQAEKLITTSKELEKKIDGRGPKKQLHAPFTSNDDEGLPRRIPRK